MEIPYFVVDSADPYERGLQLGEQAADRIAGSIAVYEETFAHWAGIDWTRAQELASRFRAPITAFDPAIMTEMDGIAAGAGVGADEILAVNVRTEMMFGVAPAECTSFSAGPGATRDGHVLVGQNWDWRPRCSETTIAVEVRQGDRPSFVMITEAGLVGKMGFNDCGVGLAANFLSSGLDSATIGVPFHVTLRAILNSRSVEEAIHAVMRAERSPSANYLIANRDGLAVDLETAPGGADSVFMIQPERDLLAHSNNFCCAVPFTDVGVGLAPDSPHRLARIRQLLEAGHGSLDVDGLHTILSDHQDFPSSICKHPKPEDGPVDQASTVASWVVDLTAGRVHATLGNPCEDVFHEIVPGFSDAVVTSAV
jgi:isopenicillin-N N-acyltransferase-like protein